LSNGTLWSNKSGPLKERTQTSGEMGTGCQRNGDQSSVESWLVQPIKELSSAAWRCAVRAMHILGN